MSARRRCVAWVLVALAFALAPTAARAVQPSARLAATPERFGLEAETVALRAAVDSVALEGWWVPGPRGAHAVVLAGSATGNRADLLPVARMFHDQGLSVLLFDYRDFGPQGPGPADSLRDLAFSSRWVDDACGALAFARAHADSGAHVFGWGTGLGSIVLLAAVTHPGHLADGIVIDNPYGDVDAILRHDGTAVIPDVVARHRVEVLPRDEPRSCADRLRTPVLLILAGREDAPPASVADDLFRLSRTRVDRWLLPDAKRADLLLAPGYAERVTRWLRERERAPGRR